MRELDEKSKHRCLQLAAEMDMNEEKQRSHPQVWPGAPHRQATHSSETHPKFLLPSRAGKIKVDSVPRDKK